MIEIGEKVRFRPAANYDKSAGFRQVLGVEITGTVVQINEARHWYRVAYQTPKGTQYECFPIPVDPEPEEPKDCQKEHYKRYCGGYHHFTGQAFRRPTLPDSER